MHFYQGILKSVSDKNGIFIPCVSPGFTINRETNHNSIPFRGRKLGETYDKWWKTTLADNPEFVAIISFNEWHEGTQIEPAVREPQYPERYYSYDRSYGKTGVDAQTSYLNRTERWIRSQPTVATMKVRSGLPATLHEKCRKNNSSSTKQKPISLSPEHYRLQNSCEFKRGCGAVFRTKNYDGLSSDEFRVGRNSD
jgi:hypothetical protein